MVVNVIKPLNQIATYLKLQTVKISINDNALPTRVSNKKTSSGYINIILELLNEAHSDLEGCTDLEKSEVRQWIEYTILYAACPDCANQVLKELHKVLATKTYLVSHKLTVADIFLYYVLHPVMENLAILEKEKFVNVSRWFDNMQHNPPLRQSNKMIDFNTLHLATLAPARH